MNPWWCKTLFDPSVFWVMVTGAATAVLTVVAAWQLSALARTSRADFIFRLKNEFFTERARRLICLIDGDLLEYVSEGQGYFRIKNFNSDATQREIGYYVFEGPNIPSQEIDDLILGIFEDLGMFKRKKAIQLEDVYVIFDTYIVDCLKNATIKEYLNLSRRGRDNTDVYAELRLLSRRLKNIEPKMRKKYGHLLKTQKPLSS
jgi:hypothetical protein